MIFNGIEKDYIRVNMSLFRPPTPPIEFFTKESRKGGSRTRKKRFTAMTLPVPVTIMSSKPVEFLKEEISNWLYHDDPKKLTFKQIPNRYYLAEYESVELDEKVNYARGNIYFYLAQANRFGPTKTIEISTVEELHEIKGQTETPWKTKTVFTSSQSQYRLGSSAGIIELNYEFITGDVLEIDYETRDITLNGNNLDVGLSLNSKWFDLEVGYMTLKASHSTQLTYTERYY